MSTYNTDIKDGEIVRGPARQSRYISVTSTNGWLTPGEPNATGEEPGPLRTEGDALIRVTSEGGKIVAVEIVDEQ
jgi:hypothetical protein